MNEVSPSVQFLEMTAFPHMDYFHQIVEISMFIDINIYFEHHS